LIFVKNLLTQTDFNQEKIGKLASVPVSFAEMVKPYFYADAQAWENPLLKF
jgi:hypothetical protein